jgi:molecular chaperone GrpE (heat shock protein)
MASKTKKTAEKPEVTTNSRKPSEQALQAVDVAIGAAPTVAENVRTTAETWTNSESRSQEIETLQKRVQNLRDPQARTEEIESLRKRLGSEIEKAEAKGGDVRRQVTDQLIGQARKARERVEPVYRDRVEPVIKERVEPVYKQRFEPAVKRVRERI